MSLAHVLLLVAAGAHAPAADTVVQASPGDRLVVAELSGAVVITSWDRDAIEVAGADRDDDLAVRRSGSELRVGYAERVRRGRPVEGRIRVPRWMAIEIGSRSLDLSIRGVDGDVRVGTIDGDVRVDDAGGFVEVRTIRGDVFVTNARGGVRASSQGDDVTIRGAEGPIEAHSGDGDVLLEDVRSASVRVEAQDGDVTFEGAIQPGGSYGFFVHDGDAVLALPAGTDARVSVSTFDGDFQSEFPVRLDRFSSGRAFEFVLGSGSAQIQIEVFDGEIHLLER
ncbi:MAG TPA: DUF4097 family beta strand repeat-containing protein [Longimicrobiales bacterium]|nr:DUF4097 family beta strand repeat-containing protein [Longimicrobiales bacterium]